MLKRTYSSLLFVGLVAWLCPDLQDFIDVMSYSRSLTSEQYPLVSECLTPELTGSWVKDPNRTFLNPVCCSSHMDDFKKYPNECGTTKMKRNNGTRTTRDYHGSLEFLPHHDFRTCMCKRHDPFVWHSPALADDWTAQDFCKTLAGRRLLLIGDSLTSQMTATLMNAVHAAKCQTNIYFAQSTLLLETIDGAIAQYSPDIVVMNFGAHMKGEDRYKRHLKQVLDTTKKHQQDESSNIQFVWITQAPAGCTMEMRPQHPFVAARMHNWSNAVYVEHGLFFDRDLYAISEMQQAGIPFVDMRMLYSRTDAHIDSLATVKDGKPWLEKDPKRDCLHYCGKGPLEVFPLLLLRLLKNEFQVSQCLNKKEQSDKTTAPVISAK